MTSPSPQTQPSPSSSLLPKYGVWVGILCGVCIGLWNFAPVRYTLSAQLQLAFATTGLPWMHPLDAKRSEEEIPCLDAAVALAPNDYLIHVGRATIMAEASSLRSASRPLSLPMGESPYDDRTLKRLALLVKNFPDFPGAHAHFARYMMANRVRIQRMELEKSSLLPSVPSTDSTARLESSPPRSLPARRSDVRLMEWALKAGEQHDPENAFWPAMLAATYFAAERDDLALKELARAAHRRQWKAYIYEEVLGQWKLFAAAYGDNGATQQIAPLSLVAFPHLHEIRRAGEMARWLAERAASEGHYNEAVSIRRHIAWLGKRIRDNTEWAYEAIYGTDLIFIATTTMDTSHPRQAIYTVAQWEQAAQGYQALLLRAKRKSDYNLTRDWVKESCALRQQVDVARYDASFPGVPPGIPLVPLFGNWMAGACLLQQMCILLVAALLASWSYRRLMPGQTIAPRTQMILWVVLSGITCTSGGLLFLGVPSPRSAAVFLVGVVLLGVLGMERLGGELKPQWTRRTTFQFLVVILVPEFTALYLLRPVLSGLHPVAALLTNMLETGRTVTLADAFQVALLAGAFPLALFLAGSIWGLFRRVLPLAGALLAFRKVALPAFGCLAFAYLLLLQQTLRIDTKASHAISEAAKNDLQWVLTHSEAVQEEEP